MAGIGYGGDRLPIAVDDVAFVQHGLRPAGYVTLHNGFDPRFFTQNDRATKCYPHFGEVARLLKQRWPGLTIVQLGTRTSERVADADLNLIGATTLPQAAGLIAHARLHIDNEGGLVHLARCLGVTCCVVFGPTPASYFGYAGNINIEPTFCGGCWWMTETWMDTCPRGFAAPRCMSEQDPRVVASSIVRFLAAEPGRLRGSAAVLAAD
jgi:ADP-heptose:LPS heptosyltransferase